MPEDDRTDPPTVVKKYANRRLYDTESSIYITLDTLADMVRQGRDFVVYDAKTGDDITRAVLTQIIMEEEIRGSNMLPTAFLRQLIGFYGDRLQGLVPEYLERMMEQFVVQQNQARASVRTLQTLLPPEIEEVGRQNLAMMDRAMSTFSPFHRPVQDPLCREPSRQEASAEPAATGASEIRRQRDEIAALREEVARLCRELACIRADLPEAGLAESVIDHPVGGIRH